MPPEPETDFDRQFFAKIVEHRWGVLSIPDDESVGVYSYTVGMRARFGHELCVFGIAPSKAVHILNHAGNVAEESGPFAEGERRSDILNGYDCVFRTVAASRHEDLFTYGLWYNGRGMTVLQLVWPDDAGRFPWDDGYDRPQTATWEAPGQ